MPQQHTAYRATRRRLDVEHGALRRDKLLTAGLDVFLRAAEAGKQKSLLAGDKGRAVEFCRDLHVQPAFLQCRSNIRRIGRRDDDWMLSMVLSVETNCSPPAWMSFSERPR